MAKTAYFPERIAHDIAPMLHDRGYFLQHDIAARKPPQSPAKYYLAYLKPLDTLGYAHVVFVHSSVHRDPQEFWVLLLRYAGTEPYESHAAPIAGRPRTNITGYLNLPPDHPLPPTIGHKFWPFTSEMDLQRQLFLVRERLLDLVLPWLESPKGTLFFGVEKRFYAEPFEQFVRGQIDGPKAYAAIQDLVPEGYFVEAGDEYATRVIGQITTILRSYAVQPIQAGERTPYTPAVMEYLLACLTDKQQFDQTHYRQMLNGAYFSHR